MPSDPVDLVALYTSGWPGDFHDPDTDYDRQTGNLAPHTQTTYLKEITRFARYFGKSPELLGETSWCATRSIGNRDVPISTVSNGQLIPNRSTAILAFIARNFDLTFPFGGHRAAVEEHNDGHSRRQL